MTLTFIIISIVLNLLNLGLIFLLYRAVGKLDDSQMTMRNIFANIWERKKSSESYMEHITLRYEALCQGITEKLNSFRAETKSSNLRLKDMSEKYDQFYEVAKNSCYHIGDEMSDISMMLSDVWWATVDSESDTDLFDEDLEALDSFMRMFSDISTGIDGIEADLQTKYPDMKSDFLIAPIRNKLESMFTKIRGVKEANDTDKYGPVSCEELQSVAEEAANQCGEAPGVCEGAQEEGLEGEEDRAEPWDEYDEVQGAPEDGENDGEAGSGE